MIKISMLQKIQLINYMLMFNLNNHQKRVTRRWLFSLQLSAYVFNLLAFVPIKELYLRNLLRHFPLSFHMHPDRRK